MKQHFAQPSTPAATSYIHLLLCSAPFDCPQQENRPLCNFRNQQFLSGPQTSQNKPKPLCISRRERPSSSDPQFDSALHPTAVQFKRNTQFPPVSLYNKLFQAGSSTYWMRLQTHTHTNTHHPAILYTCCYITHDGVKLSIVPKKV